MTTTAQKKYVYLFGKGISEGRADMKNLLGGKGANLAEMAILGLPVPAGSSVAVVGRVVPRGARNTAPLISGFPAVTFCALLLLMFLSS